MKFAPISIIAVILVVIALVCAGCSGTSSTTPAATPAAGGSSSGGAAATAAPASGSSSSAPASGSSLFGGLSYNFVEYKISTGSGDQAMTIYFKYDKAGKCSMRFEGPAAAQLPASMSGERDCSSQGGQTQSNPNQVSSDAQVTCSPVDESVTVPAGTFTATKCTVTANGASETVWVVKNKFLVKMQGGSSQGGAVDMVLNSYG
jgi:hypothetical protein